MSPKSRGRKRKSSSRPGGRGGGARRRPNDPVAELIAVLGASLAEAADGADPFVAEIVGSAALDRMAHTSDGGSGPVPSAALVDRCLWERTPEALAVLLILAELGEDEDVRLRAATAAEWLRELVEPPGWAGVLGRAQVVGCWQLIDVYGDQASILCEFGVEPLRTTIPNHGLMFLVDFNGPGVWVKDIAAVRDTDEIRAEMRRQEAASEGLSRFEQVPAAQVHDVLAAGLATTVKASADDLYDEPGEDFWALCPLAAARLRRFSGTAGGWGADRLMPEDLADIVEQFAGSDDAQDLDLPAEEVRRFAGLIVQYGNELDAGRPLRVGPGKSAAFLVEQADHDVIADDDVVPLAEVVMAWNEWAADRQGLSEDAVAGLLDGTALVLEEVLEVAFDDDDFTTGPAAWPTSGPGAGRGEPDAVARRQFAMPHRAAVIDGEHYPRLDPADPDDLQLLVIGEHPEYHHLLSDLHSEELVDGVNPRLHIAMLTVVITRLWNDEPKETWRAAKKMLAAGMERREILDALVEPVAAEVDAALSPELGLMGEMSRSRRERGGHLRVVPDGEDEAGREAPELLSFQVRVDIVDASPPIWRRLSLPATMTLAELHLTLQLAFGWTDSHLHHFVSGLSRFGGPRILDAAEEVTVRLRDVLTGAGDRLEYEYDFGDSWRHRLVVEDVVAGEGRAVRCLGGRRAGPPEDCGGIWTYNELVRAWSDPRHPSATEAHMLLDGDPAEFDRELVDDRVWRVPVS